MMRGLYVMVGLVALTGVANGAERYGDGRTHLYGPNGAYLGQCLDRQNGIRDCYDRNGGYLEPFNLGVSQADQTYGKLQALSGPEEQAAIVELGKQMHIKLDELKDTVRLRRDASFEAAKSIVLNNSGKNAMDVIRGIVARFSDARLVQIRNQREAVAELREIIGGAFLISLLLTTALLALTIGVVFTKR